MAINVDAVYKSTWEHYLKAKKNVVEKRMMFEHSDDAISDVIPGFEADKLEFGSYDKENFAVLFVDMKNSTLRAQTVGAEKTFLTMHVYLTALLEVVKHYQGKVIDIMGDGVMVFWGGREAREKDGMVKTTAIKPSLMGILNKTNTKKTIAMSWNSAINAVMEAVKPETTEKRKLT